ncbi:sigma-70 family RNA polymerase sigma factor [Porticoccus sp. W117]|uniref:RNA polymerase sigma factor n=1 Tax=Porticoccus sp. W117 TaxID=3054777 RepID=UPI00259934A4|nr:sigma-70 family RNA polymerase sigma factor [Porticoccus sp. W117]MDM3870697.1 sigma-70 family RNA polymerase sigma factor [Porticoccus sp. W117]
MAQTKSKVIDLNQRKDSRRRSLEKLFQEDGRILRGYLFKRLRNEAEVEDVAQEVFAKLARMPDLDQRISQGKNRNFLITIANNLVVDMERKRATRRSYQDEQRNQSGYLVYELSPEVEVVANEELSLLKTAIMKLKPTWRRAFTMSRFHNMTYREISEEMGVGVKQVEKYITNALMELRKAVYGRRVSLRGKSDGK